MVMIISDNAKFSFLRHLYDEMLVVFREKITHLLYLLLRKAAIDYKIRLENQPLQTRRIFS